MTSISILLLLVGLCASGINSRVRLLHYRGAPAEFMNADAQRSIDFVIFELVLLALGVLAFYVCLKQFPWYLPIMGLFLGFSVVGPVLVNRDTFEVAYNLKFANSFISLVCYAAIVILYYY